MKQKLEIVTGYGGSVVLGHLMEDKFIYRDKFPRKQKKEMKKKMPWLKFPKNPIDYVINKCVPKEWYDYEKSFALKIIDKPLVDGERHIYFSVTFFENEEVTEKHLFYKKPGLEPVKNLGR